MRKPWTYQRKNRPGWYVGWYDNTGKRRSKNLPNKSLADRHARRIEHRINEEIFVNPIAVPWDDMVTEYLEYKKSVQGLSHNTLRQIETVLKQFRQLHGPVVSTKIDQRLVNQFVANRLETAAKTTVNKDIRNLHAFIRWAVKSRYMGASANKIEWPVQKESKRPVKSLTEKQLANLLIAAKSYQQYGDAWYIRILLAVSSGLRQGDIERLRISDIDFESSTINTFSQKTGKGMTDRPLHPVVVAKLTEYIQNIPAGQDRLFTDIYIHRKWARIRKKAGLPTLKFHSLRKTFGSFVAQAGFSTSVVQGLLEHSTGTLTQEIYLNVRPVYRQAIEAIPLPKSL